MNKRKNFSKVSKITLLAVYILIVVGGIVRSSGSGMGCPDWPKCFGNYIPPTSVAELPENYKEIYAAKREKKNIRFAAMLNALGFESEAQNLLNDASILVEEDFNTFKTWTEYINRLVGALIGILVLLVFILSLRLEREYRGLKVLTFLNLLLVIFQGWLGSIVVSTNLLPWMVTVHMLPALVIVALLLYFIFKTSDNRVVFQWNKSMQILNWAVLLGLVLIVVQIVIGTQVREGVDAISELMEEKGRDTWVLAVGTKFFVHRSFSILLVAVYGFVFYQSIKHNNIKRLKQHGVVLLGFTAITILTGMVLAYLALPPAFQPVHLLLGLLIFGVLFSLLLENNRYNSINK